MLKKMETETLKQIYNMLNRLIDGVMVAFITVCITFGLLYIAADASRTEWVNLAGGIYMGLMFAVGFILIITTIMMVIDIEIKDRRTDK